MRYPKEQIALENERTLMRWLKANDHKLPTTIYQLAKELNWSFGATRGTLLRLEQQIQSGVMKHDLIDAKSKRFKTKIAIRGRASEQKLLKELEQNTDSSNSTLSLQPTSIFPIEEIRILLRRMQELDEKVALIANEIKDLKLLQKFLDYNFGLSEEEKTLLDRTINIVEEI